MATMTFGKETTTDELLEGRTLSGRRMLVTGGTSGLSRRARSAADAMTTAACAARRLTSSMGSAPNTASNPVGLSPARRPPKASSLSTKDSARRLQP